MIRENTRKILAHVNGMRAFQSVAEISTYHRIQASTGFRAAAEHCRDKLVRMGFKDAQVLTYPATDKYIFSTYPSFQEWDCKAAWCELVGDSYKRIADFDAVPISVIQKSIACDYRDKPLDVVMLDKGTDEAAYARLDLKGKIVFVRDDINKVYKWAVEKKGAVGLITDFVLQDPYVRERHDQSDTLRYTSFWWQPGQKKAFGFVLSPREGDKFAQLCADLAKEGKYPQVKCYIESSLYDGSIENVTAFLPGETEEEILLVGHLCHPRSSANDNASGSASLMEALKTLKEMLDTGELAPLKRGVRILLVPEFLGSYAYFDKIGKKEASRIKAAFNLDMVGGRQLAGYGPLTITDLPMCTPSPISDTAAVVLDEIRHQVVGMMPESYCAMFNSHFTEYSGGSDHVMWSDPKVGVPCLMLGQWPDKYYHTSSDTLEVVDPYMLSRSAALAASFAYSLSNLEEGDINSICSMGLGRAVSYITDLQAKMERGVLDPRFYAGRLKVYTQWRLGCIDGLKLWLGDGVSEQLEGFKARLLNTVKAAAGYNPLSREPKNFITRTQAEKYSLVARRLKDTPVQIGKYIGYCGEEGDAAIAAYQKNFASKLNYSICGAFDYYIDGKSTTAEIARRVAWEFGVYAPDVVDAYVKLLVKIGLAEEV